MKSFGQTFQLTARFIYNSIRIIELSLSSNSVSIIPWMGFIDFKGCFVVTESAELSIAGSAPKLSLLQLAIISEEETQSEAKLSSFTSSSRTGGWMWWCWRRWWWWCTALSCATVSLTCSTDVPEEAIRDCESKPAKPTTQSKASRVCGQNQCEGN